MAQSWRHLLFAHWPVPLQRLRSVVPDELPIDTYDGQAWLGVTPFEVFAFRLHGTLPLPYLSSFPEVNVRTYVTVGDKPGIFFLSLDAASRFAVAAARRLYRLPYFPADMRIKVQRETALPTHRTLGGGESRLDIPGETALPAHTTLGGGESRLDIPGGGVAFESRRTQADAPDARLRCRYAPTGGVFRPEPHSLEHWLTERYCLYTLDEHERLLRGEINHRPWELQRAQAVIELNTMTRGARIGLRGAALTHYARRQDVVFWRLQPA
jgi:uncharacterized protein YqjF (DUF2071 family)